MANLKINTINVENFIQGKGISFVKGSDGETYVCKDNKLYHTNGQAVQDMLILAHKEEFASFPKQSQVKDYVRHLEVLARQEAVENQLNLRVAKDGQEFFYDLGDLVVKSNMSGWDITETSPIYFKLFGNMARQVKPEKGNIGLSEVLKFVNLADENSRVLFQVYLVSCFVPDIAHPIPMFHGEKGAAKSTVLRLLRKLVDPAKQELMLLPRNQNELAQCIAHNYMPAFDNLDKLNANLSDLLCCAVTGGSLHKRKLYTDMEDVVIPVKSCITLNGVNVVATRSDLLDRSIMFEVKRIPESQRQTERAFWTSFEGKRPYLLGAIFDVLVGAMKIMATGDIKKDHLPRMADFAQWGYAIAEAAGIGGENFIAAYSDNIHIVNEEIIASDPVADSIVSFMEGRTEPWSGFATELLKRLIQQSKDYNLPTMPNALSRRLKEVVSNLEAMGIECTFIKDRTNNKTMINLKNINAITVIPGGFDDAKKDAEEGIHGLENEDGGDAGGELAEAV